MIRSHLNSIYFFYLECLIELEPVLKTFEEITFLEAVMQLKKTKVNCQLKYWKSDFKQLYVSHGDVQSSL